MAWVGEHELLRPLGGMRGGELWLVATGTKKRRRAVLRFVPPELIGGRASFEEFVNGSDAAAAVDSPHVARAIDRGVDAQGRAFVVYALDAGETLRSLLLRERWLSPPLACEIVRQAAAGLGALHEARRTHRDVRPDTLFVSDGLRVALLDAGIRTASHRRDVGDHLEEHAAFAALAPYASPERLAGKPVTRHVDLWSLAVIAHQLFAGRLPLEPATSGDPQLPAALESAFARAFHRDPSKRFQSAGHFVETLLDALEMDDQILSEARATHATPAQLCARPASSKRAIVTHLVAVMVGALLAGAYLLGRAQAPAADAVTPLRVVPPSACAPCEAAPAPRAGRDADDRAREHRPDYGF